MKSFLWFFLVLVVLLFSSAPIFVSVTHAEIDEKVAASTVDSAEASMLSAYEVVLGAEQEGADVSGLLVKLGDAADLLAKAQIAYGLGQFDDVAIFADLCSDVCEGVESDALELYVRTQGTKVWELLLAFIVSLVGVFVVAFASFLGWGYVKKRYVKKALKMKPEVAEE